MQIIIDSPGITISTHLQELINGKMKHLAKMNGNIMKCRMVLREGNNDHNTGSFMEAQLTLPGKIMFASERAATLEIALDKLVDDLRSQISHHKK